MNLKSSLEQWEYYTTFIEAQMATADVSHETMIPAGNHPKFSPYATMPELNRLGEKGWELVTMQPVIIGKNHDVMVHPNNITVWASSYFCVFKRRLQ